MVENNSYYNHSDYQQYYYAGYAYSPQTYQQYYMRSFAAEAAAGKSGTERQDSRKIGYSLIITLVLLLAVSIGVYYFKFSGSSELLPESVRYCRNDFDCVPRCCNNKWVCVNPEKIHGQICKPCSVDGVVSGCFCRNNLCGMVD